MNDQSQRATQGEPEGRTFAEPHANEPILSSIVEHAGLQEIAYAVEGQDYVVCDASVHGAQGCADKREAASHQQVTAECAALGLAILMAVMVGSLAVTFVNLITKLAAPVEKHRVCAVFPKHLLPTIEPEGESNHGI
ncbi:hypothetical protein EH31_10435 [Erythrobacter longus]|uniref:Uncharacterized protein n=1 Tax=Erythrobacter longus TaxID=1044 RepID=A0A074M6V4_ERYLO|nr:hypothetical protein [Erythrobacter longus]KEO90496.1 hypothetical protein EH31_10435 [Erythrobacter longus]